ncbi:hypothetical protein VMCG_09363 [Cytospora schulzeri]|uniref:Uncharacterized protein n=1 Tax=Cytospora schulzeri TaxID=448051 RepID=A0A423VJR5_9PEZI|nr:hypothetical protein VMCG_09363 [Valsa malicola]
MFLKALTGLSFLSSLAAATPSEVLSKDFADPSIIYDPNSGDWYAFATAGNGANVQVANASSSTGPWNLLDLDLLPNGMGSWAVDTGIWAPDVRYLSDSKSFVMYYAGLYAADNKFHCIGAATADSIEGPYSPVDDPLACPTDKGGNGGLCNNGVDPIQATPIMLQQVDSTDGTTLVGSATQVLDRSDTDGPLVEAPNLVLVDGTYIIFFSSSCYSTTLYDLSYATSSSLAGPYTKSTEPLLVTGDYDLTAPGGATSVEGGSTMFTMLTSSTSRLGLLACGMLLGGIANALTIPEGYQNVGGYSNIQARELEASPNNGRVPLNCSAQELGTFNLLLQDQGAQAMCMMAFAEHFATTTVTDVITSSITQETVVATFYQTVEGTTTVAIGFVDFSAIPTPSTAMATSMSMTTSTSMQMTTSTSMEMSTSTSMQMTTSTSMQMTTSTSMIMSTSTTLSTSMTMSTSLSLALSFLTSTTMSMSTSMIMSTSMVMTTSTSVPVSTSTSVAVVTSATAAAPPALLGANPLYLGYRKPTPVKRSPNEFNAGLVEALQTAPPEFKQNFCSCAMKREGRCRDDCDDYYDEDCDCDSVTTTFRVTSVSYVVAVQPVTTTIPVTSLSYIFATQTLA